MNPQHVTENGVTKDEDGWYSATCVCGALSPSVPDLETLADALMEHAAEATLREADIWILGHWHDLPSGANWEITGAFRTRQEAVEDGQPGEFVARLPMGRSPLEPTVFPDAEWIDDTK